MSQRKAYFEPYAKQTGTKITEEEYNGEIAKIRAMVEAKSVTWDVVDVDSGRRHPGLRGRHARDHRLGQARPRPLQVHRRRHLRLRRADDPLFDGHRL